MINCMCACCTKTQQGEWAKKYGNVIGKCYPISSLGWSISKIIKTI